jgi:ketosteroid isomerase-like protein
MKQVLLATVLLLAALFSISGQAADQQAAKKKTATSGELFDTIDRMDSAMFDAFNGHDVDRLMSMFTDDLEFYHDTGGVTNYEQTKESFKKLFANTPDIRRDLVKGSLEVYPIKDYGAIETGEHVFCHEENGNGASPARTDCGRFKFAMVWRKDGESWKISRVISYGH